MSDLLNIPGMAEAVEKELTVWDAAFLPVNESVAGFEVRPMTFADCLILRLMKSPLLIGGTPSPLDLVGFLWVLSPDYTPRGGAAKSRFLKRCRAFLPKSPPWFKTKRAVARWEKRSGAALLEAATIIKSARAYVAETFQDRPPRRGEAQDSYYSDACAICATFAREYGWTRSESLNMPIKQAFQFFKECRQHHRPKSPMFKPSDRVVGAYVAGLNPQPEPELN